MEPTPEAAAANLRNRIRGSLLSISLWAVTLGGVHAQVMDDTSWASLTAVQRTVLAPLQPQWPSFDASQRQKWIDIAQRVGALPPDARARLTARLSQWIEVPADERAATRLQFRQAQRWSADERRTRWDEYQSLHPQARKVLAERWKQEAAARADAGRHAPETAKRNIVELSTTPAAPPRAATPTTVRARTGATSIPMTAAPGVPLATQVGLPKVSATATFVDPATLLPRRGPQAADMVIVPADKPAQ